MVLGAEGHDQGHDALLKYRGKRSEWYVISKKSVVIPVIQKA